MKQSMYKNRDELPMFLTVMEVAGLLGISRASAYELVLLCIESNMCIWRLLKPQPNNDTVGATPQRKVAVLGGTDRAKITKKRGIFHDNRN